MEMQGSSKSKTPTFHFKDEDIDSVVSSEGKSVGEVMEVVASRNSKAVHPITVMTFPKKNERVACRALLDQCCIDKGLIRYELVDTLGLSGEMSHSKSFMTASGMFTTNHTVQIDDVMLPCLSQNCTFTITLMVLQNMAKKNDDTIPLSSPKMCEMINKIRVFWIRNQENKFSVFNSGKFECAIVCCPGKFYQSRIFCI